MLKVLNESKLFLQWTWKTIPFFQDILQISTVLEVSSVCCWIDCLVLHWFPIKIENGKWFIAWQLSLIYFWKLYYNSILQVTVLPVSEILNSILGEKWALEWQRLQSTFHVTSRQHKPIKYKCNHPIKYKCNHCTV